MIKIKLEEINKHRNEITFRPYIMAHDMFRQIGIEFVTDGKCDFSWVGQASVIDKKLSLEDSVSKGLEFLNNIKTPYFIFDGQDSASLIGVFEVFKESSAELLLKNTLYSDIEMYKIFSPNGRIYWGEGNYSIPDIGKYIDRILLSGTNWLHSIKYNFNVPEIPKIYDVCALFSYPSKKDVYEHGLHQSFYYDKYRKLCIDQINLLNCKVAKLKNGEMLPAQEYYRKMASSKIIVAPFGYGEMAPRDMESCVFNSVLIKPDMSHIQSFPMIYENNKTYISCKHDYSDLSEKIEYVMSDYDNIKTNLVENFKNSYISSYTGYNIVAYIHDVLTKKINLFTI